MRAVPVSSQTVFTQSIEGKDKNGGRHAMLISKIFFFSRMTEILFHKLQITDHSTLYEAEFALNLYDSDLCIIALPRMRKTVTFRREKMAAARGWTQAGRCLSGDLDDGTVVAAAHYLALANVVPVNRTLDVREHRPTLDGQDKNLDWIQEEFRN